VRIGADNCYAVEKERFFTRFFAGLAPGMRSLGYLRMTKKGLFFLILGNTQADPPMTPDFVRKENQFCTS
jgi:hypothetical protein